MRAFHDVIAVGDVVVRSATVRRYRSRSPSRPRTSRQNSSIVAGSSRSRRVATWYMSEVIANERARLVDVLAGEPEPRQDASQSSAPALEWFFREPLASG